MKVSIGMDHAGVVLRTAALKALEDLDVAYIDHGTRDDASVDYPDYASAVSQDVQSGVAHFGILVCSTGVGMSIAANKVKGVRAALVHNTDGAHLARAHNDANVLCMGARYVSPEDAAECIRIFLQTDHEGGRHSRRVHKLEALDA